MGGGEVVHREALDDHGRRGDDDIGVAQEFMQTLDVAGGREIEDDAALAGIVDHPGQRDALADRRQMAGRRTGGRLDLDDLGAQIAEEPG